MAPVAGLQHKLTFPGERAELWAQVISFCQVRDIPGGVGGAEARWGIRRAVLCAAALSPRLQWAHGHCRQTLNASKVCITAIYFPTRFPRGACVLQLMDRGKRGVFRTGQQSYITNF